MAAAALTASAASLVSASADASSFFVGLGQQQQQRQQQGLQQQHLLGGIPVIIPSTMSVASELSLADDVGSHAQQRSEHWKQQQQCPGIAADSAAAGDAGSAGSSSCTPRPAADDDGELDVADEEPDALLLLSAGGDGMLRVWLMNHLAQGQMLCTLPGGCCELACSYRRKLQSLQAIGSCMPCAVLCLATSPVSATPCSSHLCLASPCYAVGTWCWVECAVMCLLSSLQAPRGCWMW
jgi:hypothetical protein